MSAWRQNSVAIICSIWQLKCRPVNHGHIKAWALSENVKDRLQPDFLELRLSAISDRIRQGREAAGLTLLQLADRSGVAPSTIQKIENRQMTPSILILLKIAAGLSIEAIDLIASENPSPLDTIVQRAGAHAVMVTSLEVRSEKLSADIVGAELECWRVTMAPGHHSRLDRPQMLNEQVVLCERGEVELDFGGSVHRLFPGDTLHCRRKNLHAFGNPGPTEASYVITGMFPHSVLADIAARPTEHGSSDNRER